MSDPLQKQELELSIRQLEKELFVLFCISLYFCQQIYLNKLDESINLIKQIMRNSLILNIVGQMKSEMNSIK